MHRLWKGNLQEKDEKRTVTESLTPPPVNSQSPLEIKSESAGTKTHPDLFRQTILGQSSCLRILNTAGTQLQH